MLNLQSNIFHSTLNDNYPPFKTGCGSMDQYFIEFFQKNCTNINIIPKFNNYMYLDVNWSGLMLFGLQSNKEILSYLENVTNNKKLFTVAQDDYDPRTWSKIPQDCLVFGGSSGTHILPLLYDDPKNSFMIKSMPYIKEFNQKKYLCSFVGSTTHNVRQIINDKFQNHADILINSKKWSREIDSDKQELFIDISADSKFVLAPRGNGRSSFRFFETFQLKSIPVYVWDDIEWLPFKNKINYDKLCISINIKDIDNLPNILNNIDETQYNQMLSYYDTIKHMFTMDYTCKYVIETMINEDSTIVNNTLQLYYGNEQHKVNITSLVPITHNLMFIHADDRVRQFLYNNRINGQKYIYVRHGDQEMKFDDNNELYINAKKLNISVKNISDFPPEHKLLYDKLMDIHAVTRFDYGSLLDEFPEQLMTVKYLTGHEKVLEIGGNFGRNSLIIAYLLNNSTNFVVMESNEETAKKLQHNRDINGYLFNVEASALSKYNMIQNGWSCMKSDIILDGFIKVNTITYNELCKKYNIKFDTLILDCEGAFYDILADMPEILDGVKLVIIENDFTELHKKQYVDYLMTKHGLKIVYSMAGGFGPCQNNFYEVWSL